jgi:hypothetical protein
VPEHPLDWSEFDLAADPVLAVGWRPRAKALAAAAVALHAETFSTMREIAAATQADFLGREPLPWHPNAHIEAGEQYLYFEHGAHQDAADLIQLVTQPADLETISLEELQDGALRFYAIIWEEGFQGGPAAFVSEYDPTQVLRKASSYFRYRGTLRAAPPPDFALNDRADMIITGTHVAMLRATPFDRLFSDIRAALNDVSSNVTVLRHAMVGLPMSAASAKAFETVCATRPSFARRLAQLSENTTLVSQLTPRSIDKALRRHGHVPADFIAGGQLQITNAEVSTFLDIAEGRLFEADFTGEGRRAARWSAT